MRSGIWGIGKKTGKALRNFLFEGKHWCKKKEICAPARAQIPFYSNFESTFVSRDSRRGSSAVGGKRPPEKLEETVTKLKKIQGVNEETTKRRGNYQKYTI